MGRVGYLVFENEISRCVLCATEVGWELNANIMGVEGGFLYNEMLQTLLDNDSFKLARSFPVILSKYTHIYLSTY